MASVIARVRRIFFASVDVESTGERFTNTLCSIGIIVGPADGSWPRAKLIRYRADLKPLHGEVDDPRCMEKFWAQHPTVYSEIQANAKDAHVVMTGLLSFCQQLVAHIEDNPEIDGKIVLLTDCPDFDLGRLHYLGEVATKTWPTPFRNLGKPGVRHGYMNPWERLDVLGKADECADWMQRNVPGVVHDHRPDNDAEHTYYQQVFLERDGKDLESDDAGPVYK